MPGSAPAAAYRRIRAVLRRARRAQQRRDRNRTWAGRVLTGAICLFAGLLVVVSALNARGTDLRPARNTDLVSLVEDQSRRNADLAQRVSRLREEVDAVTAARGQRFDQGVELAEQAGYAGLTAVTGPAVTVTLDDAPESVAADGIDPDLLVVHQQDIQAVVNALWSGGAEAMTIQGQRVISTTGVKCVGNTVVLHGIPYAPPYVVSAMGNPTRLRSALADSAPIRIYQQYVDAYRLVYRERTQTRVTFPAHQGSLELQHASPLIEPAAPAGSVSPTETSTPR